MSSRSNSRYCRLLLLSRSTNTLRICKAIAEASPLSLHGLEVFSTRAGGARDGCVVACATETFFRNPEMLKTTNQTVQNLGVWSRNLIKNARSVYVSHCLFMCSCIRHGWFSISTCVVPCKPSSYFHSFTTF